MKRLLPVLMVFGVFIGRAGESLALPECPGSPTENPSTMTSWSDCIGTYVYGDSTLPFTSSPKTTYTGEFKDGMFHGKGTQIYRGGRSKWIGEFKDGNRQEGVWKRGLLRSSPKITPKVTAKKSPTPSLGSNQSSLPSCPEGQHQRYHNCFGTHTFGPESKWSGDNYIGEWKDGKFHGKGTYTFGPESKWSGYKYIGEWKDNKRHGQGTGIAPNGEKYVGEFKDNKAHGEGTGTYPNGDKYIGEHKNEKRDGYGVYYYLADNQFKGDIYRGEHKDGKSHGIGTYTRSNGQKYVGEYRNGAPNGKGIIYNADGTVSQEGVFENGQFKYAEKVTVTNPTKKRSLQDAKKECAVIGFKIGTEKFGNCVMKLMD